MQTLSRAQENRIIEAAERVVDLVNQGATPNDAMFKIASEVKLTPEFVRRLTEVFNTSRMLAHFSTAPPEKRADAFPLVDAAAVIARMYPRIEKPAGDNRIRRTSGCAAPPSFVAPVMEKSADSANVFGKETTHGRAELSRVVHRANLLKAAAERELDHLQTDAAYSRHQLRTHLTQAADCFWKIDRPSFAEVEAQVLAHYGALAKSAMTIVYDLCEGGSLGEKRAEGPAEHALFDENEPPYCHIRNALRAAATAAELSRKCAAAAQELREYTQALDHRLGVGQPNENVRRIPFPFDDLLDKESAVVPSLTTGVLLGNQLSQLFDDKSDTGDRLERKIQHGFDPEYEASLRAARAKTLLNELMTTDPVISKYNNEDVVAAFNEISSMTPRVANQPALLRGLLARRLELGRIDPFEASQIVTAERGLKITEAQP